MYTGRAASCEVPLFREILIKLNFFKNTQIPSFMKSHPVGAELFHADGRSDGRTGLNGNRSDMDKVAWLLNIILTASYGEFPC
jgi:hypothetical protein